MRTEVVSTPWGDLEAFSGDLITKHLKKYQAHQRSDLALLLRLLRNGDNVIDVGAHIGTFTIPIARAVGPNGSVTAVEAVSEHLEVLSRNVARNDLSETVRTVCALVADHTAEGQMAASHANTGSAHFIAGCGTTVKTVRLDDIAPQSTSLVKVDVEGMEFEVLRSGATMIERDRPVLVFEVGVGDSTGQLDDFCHRMDYRLLLNLHARNCADDSYHAVRVTSLTRLGPLPLLDVVAMPRESDRWPQDLAEPSSALVRAALTYRRARGLAYRAGTAVGERALRPTQHAS